MRFFKAFNLLHRRTKSDIFVSGSTLESAITDSEPPGRRSSVPVSLFNQVASQIPANFRHLSDRGGGPSVAVPVFSLENELNARLIEANTHWANEYANLQCQLEECRKELHTERRKVQCLQHKLEEDNRIIVDLHIPSRRFEGPIGLSSHATESLQDTLPGGTGMLQNVSTMPIYVKDSSANDMNIRTMDEYSSALRMTLATRKELRDQKKVSLYWKRKALDSNQLQSVITPSVSTISSIYDPLPVGRQIALDVLISRRGLYSISGGQMRWKDTSNPPKVFIPKLSTYQPADEVSSPIAIAQPVVSSANSSSHLGFLASESLKAEISSLFFGSPENVKHPIPRKRREQNHFSSLVGRLTKFTFATSTSAKKSDLALSIESFGDLHAILATTFGADKLLVDESNGTLNRIDMEDDLSIPMTSVLPPPTSVPMSSGPPTRSTLKTSYIPTRKRAVTSAGSHNEDNAKKSKQVSCTSRRSWQSYKARFATTTKEKTVLEERVSLNSPGREKENSFPRVIPTFKRKTSSNLTQDNS